MEKVNINGKEIEFDEKNLKPLSEEELEAAAGGQIIYEESHITVYRLICRNCQAHGPWSTMEDVGRREEVKHENTCSSPCIRMEMKLLIVM